MVMVIDTFPHQILCLGTILRAIIIFKFIYLMFEILKNAIFLNFMLSSVDRVWEEWTERNIWWRQENLFAKTNLKT